MKKLINLTLLSCLAVSSLAFGEQKQFDIKASCKKAVPYLKATAKLLIGLGSLYPAQMLMKEGVKIATSWRENELSITDTPSILSLFLPLCSSWSLICLGLNDFQELYKEKYVTFNENVETINPDGAKNTEKIKDKEVKPTVV